MSMLPSSVLRRRSITSALSPMMLPRTVLLDAKSLEFSCAFTVPRTVAPLRVQV
jgi:hypothetical protein